jgi:predicted amidohydrolase
MWRLPADRRYRCELGLASEICRAAIAETHAETAASSLGSVRAPLTIAAAQPATTAGDMRANAAEHARVIRDAGARLVVFPELSLTGYELDAPAVTPDDGDLRVIVEACAETGSEALVGAPVAGEDGRQHIAMLRASPSGIEVAYNKTHLGGDEPARFAPGDGTATIGVDDWRVGLGICKDTGVDEHIEACAALDLDLYVAGLVHHAEELRMQEDRARRIAAACRAYVAFASFAGPTGGYDRTAGTSSIWGPDGTPLARAGVEPGEFVRVRLS